MRLSMQLEYLQGSTSASTVSLSETVLSRTLDEPVESQRRTSQDAQAQTALEYLDMGESQGARDIQSALQAAVRIVQARRTSSTQTGLVGGCHLPCTALSHARSAHAAAIGILHSSCGEALLCSGAASLVCMRYNVSAWARDSR